MLKVVILTSNSAAIPLIVGTNDGAISADVPKSTRMVGWEAKIRQRIGVWTRLFHASSEQPWRFHCFASFSTWRKTSSSREFVFLGGILPRCKPSLLGARDELLDFVSHQSRNELFSVVDILQSYV
jgi:hypothetical protein